MAIRDGRTSSEVLRSGDAARRRWPRSTPSWTAPGASRCRREFREALALTRRVRLALAEDHVQIRSDRDAEEST